MDPSSEPESTNSAEPKVDPADPTTSASEPGSIEPEPAPDTNNPDDQAEDASRFKVDLGDDDKESHAPTPGVSSTEKSTENNQKVQADLDFEMYADGLDLELDEYGRSKTFAVNTCASPWFSAFHFSWMSFFLAFVGWFSFIPALEYIVEDPDMGVSLKDKKLSNIFGVLGTVMVRFLAGPLCERFGPRRVMSALLSIGAVLVYLGGTVTNRDGLFAIRFFTGLIGGAFVPCQFWTSMMFSSEVVGTANAVAGGWGNLGGGFANLFMGTCILVLRNAGMADDKAWRVAMLCPATLMASIVIPMYCCSKDCPQGDWKDRKYNSTQDKEDKAKQEADKASETETKPNKCTDNVWVDYRVWLLAFQYAACFGIELCINGSMAGYLYRGFLEDDCIGTVKQCAILDKDTASMIAALFGMMNLFARAIGGFSSDQLAAKMGIRGRLWAQVFFVLGEGLCLIGFSRITNLYGAIAMLVVFSVFVQSAEGSTFGIVPFMMPSAIGQVAGVVGAGGNIGAVCWNTIIAEVDDPADAYLYLGCIVAGMSLFTLILPVNGVSLMFGGEEEQEIGGLEGLDERLTSDPSTQRPFSAIARSSVRRSKERALTCTAQSAL